MGGAFQGLIVSLSGARLTAAHCLNQTMTELNRSLGEVERELSYTGLVA
jgi:hypothetical protein